MTRTLTGHSHGIMLFVLTIRGVIRLILRNKSNTPLLVLTTILQWALKQSSFLFIISKPAFKLAVLLGKLHTSSINDLFSSMNSRVLFLLNIPYYGSVLRT